MIQKCFTSKSFSEYLDTTSITRKHLVLFYVLPKYERWLESKIKAGGKNMLDSRA